MKANTYDAKVTRNINVTGVAEALGKDSGKTAGSKNADSSSDNS